MGAIIEKVEQWRSIIEKDNLFYFVLALILPGGYLYLVYPEKFTNLSWASLGMFIGVHFAIFFFVFRIFLEVNRALEKESVRKIENILPNILDDFEHVKNELAEISEIYRKYPKEKFVKAYFKLSEIFESQAVGFGELLSKRKEYERIIQNRKIEIEKIDVSFKKFVLLLTLSSILSFVVYISNSYFNNALISMNKFRFIYIAFFILVLFSDYLKEDFKRTKVKYAILLYSITYPIGKWFINGYKKWVMRKVEKLESSNQS